MNTPLLWAALQVVGAPGMGPSPLPEPTLVTVPSVGQVVGQVILTPSPSPGLSAIRIFVPLVERPDEAGLGRVLSGLATERTRGLAQRTGMRLSTVRASKGLVYVVTGADLDFDHISAVAAQAIAIPRGGDRGFRRVVEEILADLEILRETGRGRITSALTGALCESNPPLSGSLDALEGLTHARTAAFWQRTHTPVDIVVTVATSLPAPAVLAALDQLGKELGDGGRPPPRESRVAPASQASRPPPVLRTWYGEARLLPLDDGPFATLVGALVEAPTAQLADGYEIFAEMRDTPCGHALYTVGSSLPRDSRAVQTRVQSFVDDLIDEVDPTRFTDALARLRIRLLSEADTPAGRAAAIAAGFENEGGQLDVLNALETLRLADVTAFLERLGARTPVRSEIRP